jgi:hypothetical protein
MNTTGYTPIDDPRLLLLLVGLVIILACLIAILYAMIRAGLVSEDTREAIRVSRATEWPVHAPVPDVEPRPLQYKIEPPGVRGAGGAGDPAGR